MYKENLLFVWNDDVGVSYRGIGENGADPMLFIRIQRTTTEGMASDESVAVINFRE